VHAIQQPPILQEDNITYPAQTETNNRQFKIKINSITAKAQNKYKEPKQRASPQEQKTTVTTNNRHSRSSLHTVGIQQQTTLNSSKHTISRIPNPFI
jgi:hypothetical protein